SRLKAATPMVSMVVRNWLPDGSGPLPSEAGANASARAIRIPPAATKGMAYETPVSRYWRSFLRLSDTGVDDISSPADLVYTGQHHQPACPDTYCATYEVYLYSLSSGAEWNRAGIRRSPATRAGHKAAMQE